MIRQIKVLKCSHLYPCNKVGHILDFNPKQKLDKRKYHRATGSKVFGFLWVSRKQWRERFLL